MQTSLLKHTLNSVCRRHPHHTLRSSTATTTTAAHRPSILSKTPMRQKHVFIVFPDSISMKISEDVLNNDEEMRQVAKLAEVYHEQNMKRKQVEAAETTTATTSATASIAGGDASTTNATSKSTRTRAKKGKKDQEKAEVAPIIPEHVPTPVQTNQPLFFSGRDAAMIHRLKSQLKKFSQLMEDQEEIKKAQKQSLDGQAGDAKKKALARIYDKMNAVTSHALVGKTYNMQLNRLVVIDKRSTQLGNQNSSMPLSIGDKNPRMHQEWSDAPLVPQRYARHYDEFEAEDDVDDDPFADHARLMDVDGADHDDMSEAMQAAVETALKQHAGFQQREKPARTESRTMARRKRALIRRLKKWSKGN